MRLYKNITKIFIYILILSHISYATSIVSDGYSIAETTSVDENVNAKTPKIKRPNPLDVMRDIDRSSTKKYRNKNQNSNKQVKKLVTKKVKKQSKKKARRHYKRDPNREKIIYLTFDDGPLRGTNNVMNVLKAEGVKATMFFVGKHVRGNKKLFRKALSMPNLLVTNHTYTHANGRYEHFYSSTSRVVNDIDRAQKIIGGAKYLRLAGRNVWRLPKVYRNDYAIRKTQRIIEAPKYDAVRNRGYQIYGWDIEWEYDHSTGYALYDGYSMANKIEAQYQRGRTVKDGRVMLLAHDVMFRGQGGKNKLRQLIRMLKANGWSFSTIDSYTSRTPGVKNKSKKSSSPLDILNGLTTKLNEAVKLYKTNKITELIKMGANVNAIDTHGRLALNTAIKANSISIVKTLVQKGAKIDNHDASGITPLLMAKLFFRKDIKIYLESQINKQQATITIHLASNKKVANKIGNIIVNSNSFSMD